MLRLDTIQVRDRATRFYNSFSLVEQDRCQGVWKREFDVSVTGSNRRETLGLESSLVDRLVPTDCVLGQGVDLYISQT